MLSPHLTLVTVLVSASALAGRGKFVDTARPKPPEAKSEPRTVKAIAEALPKEKKDVNRRSALSLVLDDMLRAEPELGDASVYDQMVGQLLSDVLDRMSEPTEAFATGVSPDKFMPRADLLFHGEVKLKPGRVSKGFRRRYIKKLQGKNVDRAFRDQPATVDFAPAVSDDEFYRHVDTVGWGAIIHASHVDAASGVARIGVTFVSNGTKEAPGGRFERPSWIAFYKQVKPGVGQFFPLAIESVTASDWREQPINLVPPKAEPNELSRKLALEVLMEQVRAIPPRAAFLPQEELLFKLGFEGDAKAGEVPLSWLERYRDSDSKMVRAAAELKMAERGGEWRADSAYVVMKGVKHPVVKALLAELLKKAPQGWTPPPLPPGYEESPDAGTKK